MRDHTASKKRLQEMAAILNTNDDECETQDDYLPMAPLQKKRAKKELVKNVILEQDALVSAPFKLPPAERVVHTNVFDDGQEGGSPFVEHTMEKIAMMLEKKNLLDWRAAGPRICLKLGKSRCVTEVALPRAAWLVRAFFGSHSHARVPARRPCSTSSPIFSST